MTLVAGAALVAAAQAKGDDELSSGHQLAVESSEAEPLAVRMITDYQ
jgi:hypothetical protein